MNLTIEIEREDDGRWLCEVIGLPGVMAYGQSRIWGANTDAFSFAPQTRTLT